MKNRATLGKYINWVLAIGKDDVNNLSEELGLDTKWLLRKQILSTVQTEDSEELETQIPKLNDIKKMIKRGRPLLFNLAGEHIKSEFVGWELGEDYELGKPGAISIDLNPVVARSFFLKLKMKFITNKCIGHGYLALIHCFQMYWP